MLTDKRLQVYLPEKEYRAVKSRAREEGKSIAQVLREAAQEYLRHGPKERLREGYRRLIDGAGRLGDSATDVAENHDQYVGEALDDERGQWSAGPSRE